VAAPVNPVLWCALAAAVLSLHSGVNALLLRRPRREPSTVDERVAVLLPLRDEAHRVGPCLTALLAQKGVPNLEILVLDDGSTDGTADVVRSIADHRVRLLTGAPPPPGWLGKPHACWQLARAAPKADVLVFVDADVVLAPHAVAACVTLLRDSRADLITPYPRVLADGAQRLVQPLLQWSWLTFVPLRLMERGRSPALAAAGGQLLAVRAASYERAGGHAAVRDRVLEDVALARAVKAGRGRIALADGSSLATCRMYDSWTELTDGYTKSLWAAFGSPLGALAVLALLGAVYVVPFVAALFGSVAGLGGYLAGVLGRLVTARATGGRALPDALAHPVSIVLFAALVVRSYVRKRRGALAWKGRRIG
jgi:hypothetical protein